eukprot:TRINITY_DN30612_c0_g1_i1.p1 TRINITY_DN30612_c0_g1~~TRINITY_DN30612_c0_g1_i1.p1  ORF type:complete len:100 (+),score=20.12 TRINITY_DN30612_c0_g1_i1:73-372(+)
MLRVARPASRLQSCLTQTRGFPVMRGDEFGRHLGINPVGNPVGAGERPLSNTNTFGYSKKYADNWERVFGKKKQGKEESTVDAEEDSRIGKAAESSSKP